MVCSHINGAGAICRFKYHLFASDYFTGDGINDAVLYTLTNSLTGAGVSDRVPAGYGHLLGLTAVFGALGWILRRRRHHPHHFGYSLLASYWRWVRWTPARHFVR